MFNENTHSTLKQLCKERNCTMNSLVSALVEFALERCNVSEFTNLETPKPRGRKPGTKNSPKDTEGAVASEATSETPETVVGSHSTSETTSEVAV